MPKKLNLNTSMNEFVAEFPESVEIFQAFGINCDKEGNKNLTTAAEEKNLNIDDLISSLEDAIDEAIEQERIESWINKPLTNIIEHIEKKHHAFLWKKLPSTDIILNKIVETHSDKDKEFLIEFKALFAKFKNSLEEHLQTEEEHLFNYIKENEEILTSKEKSTHAHIFDKELIKSLAKEHQTSRKILQELRELTSNYKLPANASENLKELYGNLQIIEKDLQEHIKLEDTVLMPRIKKLI